MQSKKSIDRLFQEGLKDLQSTPSSKVWNGIEKGILQKTAAHRRLSHWPQIASIAAILAIFISIGQFYNNSKINSTSRSSANFDKSTPALIETRVPVYSSATTIKTLNKIEESFNHKILKWSSDLYNFEAGQEISSSIVNEQVNEEALKKEVQIVIANLLKNPAIHIKSKDFVITSALYKEQSTPEDKKSIFDEIENDNLIVQNKSDRFSKTWALQPTVAPVFMNSIGGGNPVEPSLQGKTSSNPNMSYGVHLAYAINKNIKIRTGINQVTMGYNTQNVVMSTTSSSLRGENPIPSNSNSFGVTNVNLIDASQSNTIQNKPQLSTLNSEPTRINSPIGSLNHELGFVEVPLEIEYALIDRKFGVHILGGASTFLLNNNELFFEGGGQTSNLGEVENLNSFSFSANFGVGMDYSFSKRISLNLEPKFMYQINTFRDNLDNFRPYFFGIYSGIKFKF